VTGSTKNRERLIRGQVSHGLLAGLLLGARENNLLSEKHFTVDGTLIPAWAAARSFSEKSEPPKPGAGSGYGGEVLLRDKVESKTDPEARLYKKAMADKSVPSYQGHALMENRNGLVVAAEASQSATNAQTIAMVASLEHQRFLRLCHASSTIGGTIRCAKEAVTSPTVASPGRFLKRVPCDCDTSPSGRPFV
jgi:hypothetical protein